MILPTDRRTAARPLPPVLFASTLALAAAVSPLDAHAQEAAALASRRELIAQAQQARTSGNHQQALELAERASRIQMSASLRLFVAQEQTAVGRLAEAYGNADQCMREAEGDTALRNHDQVAATCRALSQELRSRVGRITVQVPSPAPAGLQVRVAGSALSDSLWGVPYIVTPGHVVIEATAGGFRPFRSEVDVAAGAASDVRLALEPEASTSASSGPATSVGAVGNSQGDQAQHVAAGGGGAPVGPIVVMGVGVVVVALAPVFAFVLRNPEIDRVQAICPMFTCANDAAGMMAQPHRDAAATWDALTWVATGVGVAAIAGGLTWLLLSRPHANAPARAFDIAPSRDGIAFGLRGTF